LISWIARSAPFLRLVPEVAPGPVSSTTSAILSVSAAKAGALNPRAAKAIPAASACFFSWVTAFIACLLMANLMLDFRMYREAVPTVRRVVPSSADALWRRLAAGTACPRPDGRRHAGTVLVHADVGHALARRVDVQDVPVAGGRHRVVAHAHVDHARLAAVDGLAQRRLELGRALDLDALGAIGTGHRSKVRRVRRAVLGEHGAGRGAVVGFLQTGDGAERAAVHHHPDDRDVFFRSRCQHG